MSQSVTVHPIQLFYWKVKFEDGYILSQFDSDGNEILFKDIVTPEHYYLKDGKKTLNKNSNLFSNIEKMHGNAIKVGWYPFDDTLIEKIMKKNPDYNIQLMNNPVPHATNIPHDGYAFLKKEIGIDYAMNGDSATGYQSDLYFGYISRDGTGNGEVSHIELNIKENLNG